MQVVIVGAGLGGLSAALCLAQQGHSVQVLEQRPGLSAQGGGLNIRPGASRIMHGWGLGPALNDIGETTPSVVLRSMQSGAVVTRQFVDASKHSDYGTTREILMQTLYKHAIDAGAVVTFGMSVVAVQDSAQNATLRLENGQLVMADLILAADGVRSRIRSMILTDSSASTKPVVSDFTFYGLSLNGDELLGQLGTDSLVENASINVWTGHNSFVVSRWNSKLQTFGGLFGIKANTDMATMWEEDGDIAFVRDYFRDKSCGALRKALDLATSCDRWKIAEMPDLPRWTSAGGRIALLGDSAHAMHPNAAQGFSQIVEDVGVLEYLLARHQGGEASHIPKTLRMWEAIRKPRTQRIRDYARWNTMLFVGGATRQVAARDQPAKLSLHDVVPDMNAPFPSPGFAKWALDYDAIYEAEKYYNRRMTKL